MLLGTMLQAQSTTPQTFDPGPRALATISRCPTPSIKFPETPCSDDSEPPQPGANPPVDGAGNVVNNSGNLGLFWFEALRVFETQASVDGSDNSGSLTNSTTSLLTAFIKGLGPSFNAESCLQCHSQPSVGGSSPGCVVLPQPGGTTKTFCSANFTFNNSNSNPQFVDSRDRGANNAFFSFENVNGPLLEVRLPKGLAAGTNTAAVAPGAVAELFVIEGRSDTKSVFPNCTIQQIDLETQHTNGNTVFRISIPTFGDGFVENTPEPTLQANLAANATAKANLGIAGRFNTSGNDQTITRFGWKAQNKSMLMFSGEASNVEMGVTNELFTTERTYGNFPNCTDAVQSNGVHENRLPEDTVLVLAPNDIESILDNPAFQPFNAAGVSSVISNNIENDSVFMRLNGAPSQCDFQSPHDVCNALTASPVRGKAAFGTVATSPVNVGIGCVLCHTDQLMTGPSTTPGLSNQTFHPFSDIALHHMGGLADGVGQGIALGDEFRTAPLWGLGQRLFFLHDGRASDLLTAIEDHCLPVPAGNTIAASEACAAVTNFNNLPPVTPAGTTTTSQQDVLNFLRSL
ncbi:MAG TPA: di-heme oxidoredictase family protein [Candidatus Angelobacter sp.]